MLETRDLTIRFGGHVAVNAVSCAFAPGTLTAIVGPNGAGKTTYFNLISGQLKASKGQVLLGGRELSGLSVPERARAGLGRAFQLTNLFPQLTVQENVRLAVQATHQGKHRRGLNLWSIWSDHTGLIARADAILASVALRERADTPVASLPHGDQRKLEVALLMALDLSSAAKPAASPSISAPIRSLRRTAARRSHSSIRPATPRSPRCARAAPRSPTS